MAIDRVGGGCEGGKRVIIVRKVLEQSKCRAQRAQLVFGGEVAYATESVNARPAQIVGADAFAEPAVLHGTSVAPGSSVRARRAPPRLQPPGTQGGAAKDQGGRGHTGKGSRAATKGGRE